MEKIILLIHGYKKQEEHHFDDFYLYAKDKINCQMEKVYWFNNYEKESLTIKSFLIQIDKVMEKYSDKEIIIISFSMGASLFLTRGYKWKNITDIISIFPTYYVFHFDWFKKIYKTIKLRSKLHKKLPKERYKNLVKNNQKNLVEKYPIRLTFKINCLRIYLLKNLGKMYGKNLHIFLNQKDEINKTKKTFKELKRKINANNFVSYYWINEPHYSVLINNPNFYDKLINLLNI